MAVRVADKIKQLNDGSFKLLDYEDIDHKPFESLDPNTLDVDDDGVLSVIGGGGSSAVFFSLPNEEDWEDETVTRPFYNALKAAIDDGEFIIVTEKLSGDFDSWVYYTVAYNSVDSSEEDQEWINLTSFDGIYVDILQIHPVSISKTETEMKGEITINFDKTDIASVANDIFDAVANDLNPVLLEEVGHADYRWKFINSEQDESIGALTGYVFLCSKNGELHKLVVSNNFYQETTISNQASTMPTANAYNLGQIFQYIGTTTTDYTNGFFYKCTESSGTYSWEAVNVQPSGMSDPTAADKVLVSNNNLEWEERDWSEKQDTIPTYTLAEYEAIKDTIPEGTIFNISDDKTQVTNVINNKYSTDEVVCGEWIDGKPIYRKVLTTLQFPKVTADDGKIKAKNYDISDLNVDTMITTTMSQIWGDFNAIRFNMINPLPTFIQVATNAITSSEAPFKFIIEYTKTTD